MPAPDNFEVLGIDWHIPWVGGDAIPDIRYELYPFVDAKMALLEAL